MPISSIFDNPELVQALSEAGVFPDEMDMLQSQLKRADALRTTPGAQGREVGRTYVASSPLEHLAVGLQRYQGGKGVQQGIGQQDALLGRMRANAQAMAQAIREGAQPPQQPAPQFGPPPPPTYGPGY